MTIREVLAVNTKTAAMATIFIVLCLHDRFNCPQNNDKLVSCFNINPFNVHISCSNCRVITLYSGHTEPSLATHVLQFIFISDCGFRFPIAQFPSGQCSPSDLYLQFWKGVERMEETGFR